MVIATQNPIEQEGTYPLPEAQVDRFMVKLKIDYPSKEEERIIMKRMTSNNGHEEVQKIIDPEVLLKAQEAINSIYIDSNLEDYILNLVAATRNPATQNLPKLANLIQYGASPRASIFLHHLSRAYAFMQGRGFVVPQDIKSIGFDVLRHRVILTYEAEAENISTDDILQQIFDTVEVP
jgi:MoxR-like ATPase